MQQAYSFELLMQQLNSSDKSDVLNLNGKNTDEIFSFFIMSKSRLTKKQKLSYSNVRHILCGISPNIPTYKFNEDFNSQVFGYMIADSGLGLRPSTAKQYMRILVTTLKWAGTYGAELSKSYDFIPNDQYEPHRICPTMAEICQIYYFDIDSLPYRKDCKHTLEKVRDTYVMNAIGYGLRYSDLSRVDSSSFNGNELTLVQQKTGRVVKNSGDMVLYKSLMNSLLSKYPNHLIPFQGCIGNYNKYLKKLFQHLGGTFDNTEVIEYRAGGTLKRVEKKRWQCFSSHSARRGYVTNNVCEKKRNIIDVQHAVGHKSSKTTEGYIVYGNE